jgi:hypothetical protein
MSLIVEYFERRQAKNPSFFYAKMVNSNKEVVGLFWVDGRTRSLYNKYKDCVLFDMTFCTKRYNMLFVPLLA